MKGYLNGKTRSAKWEPKSSLIQISLQQSYQWMMISNIQGTVSPRQECLQNDFSNRFLDTVRVIQVILQSTVEIPIGKLRFSFFKDKHLIFRSPYCGWPPRRKALICRFIYYQILPNNDPSSKKSESHST